MCRDSHATVAHTPRAELRRAVVCLVYRQRAAHGLPAFRSSSRLDRSAQGWAHQMVAAEAFTHGTAFQNRITAAGFDWSTVGENIATGFATPWTVVRAWMASPGHCQNILNPTYREVGTGVLDGHVPGSSTTGGTWTQDFGLLVGQRPASTRKGPAEGCPYRI